MGKLAPVSPAVDRASAAGHTATDAPSEELKRASMRAAETAYDAGFRGLETLNSTLNTTHVTTLETLNSTLNTRHVTTSPLHPSLTETSLVTSVRDRHSSDVPSEELADGGSEAHASACVTPRLCLVSRGVHLMLSHLIATHLTHVASIASHLL
jgi:hypothetical protein